MEKSYPAYREKFLAVTKETMKIFLRKLWLCDCVHIGQELSRSSRSRLSTSEISRGTRENVSSQGEISLVNLSKCFLPNRGITSLMSKPYWFFSAQDRK